jgi:hypothetical protein
LHHRVSPLEPHVIVIYHSTNDISGNSYLLARKNGLAEKRTEKDSLRLSDYSLLVYLVEKNLGILASRNKANAPAGKLVITDQEDMRQPFRRGLEELVKQSESVSRPPVALASLSTLVRRSQSAEEQAESTETSIYYMPFMSVDSLIDSYEWYNDVIRDVAAKTDVLLIGDEHRIPGDSVHFKDAVYLPTKAAL